MSHQDFLPIASETSDEQLLKAFTETGDIAYYNELHRRYYLLLVGEVQANFHTNDGLLAEDAVQAAFMALHQNHAQFDYAQRFAPWLRTIVINKAIDAQRRHRQTEKTYTNNFSDIATASNRPESAKSGHRLVMTDPADVKSNGPSYNMELSELRQMLDSVLDELAEGDREAVRMHYYEQRPVKYIALELDVPVATVLTFLFRGRNKMRAIMERRGYSDAA